VRAWVVLPAYNEAKNLPPIFEGYRRVREDTYNLDLRFILVDDGSTDGTPDVAREAAGDLPLEILPNGHNMGLAETFNRGLLPGLPGGDSSRRPGRPG